MPNPRALGGPVDPAGRTRIGDVERDRAVAALAEHYVAGRLDLPEFEERTAAALAAKTRSDLAVTLLDLPVTASPPPARPARRRRRRLRLAIAAACVSLAVGISVTGVESAPTEAVPCSPEAYAGHEGADLEGIVCLEEVDPP